MTAATDPSLEEASAPCATANASRSAFVSVTITGSYAWTDVDFSRSLELLAGGALSADGWLTRVPLAAGQAAFEDLADRGRPFKVLLEVG